MNYRGALAANAGCKVTENSGFWEKTRARCVPRRFLSRCDLISRRYGVSFVCINAQVYVERENEEKREGKADGQGVTERERECRFERMQKSGMEEPGKRGRDGKGEKECGAVTTSK